MSDPLSWYSMLRVLAGLALVLVVLFLLLRVLRRLQPGLAGSREDFRVLASLALSPRERLLLLQLGEQQLLLGAGVQGLRCLHVLPRPLAQRPCAPVAPSFAAWLQRAGQAARVSPSPSSDEHR